MGTSKPEWELVIEQIVAVLADHRVPITADSVRAIGNDAYELEYPGAERGAMTVFLSKTKPARRGFCRGYNGHHRDLALGCADYTGRGWLKQVVTEAWEILVATWEDEAPVSPPAPMEPPAPRGKPFLICPECRGVFTISMTKFDENHVDGDGWFTCPDCEFVFDADLSDVYRPPAPPGPPASPIGSSFKEFLREEGIFEEVVAAATAAAAPPEPWSYWKATTEGRKVDLETAVGQLAEMIGSDRAWHIYPDNPCMGCIGSGYKSYPNTATWHNAGVCGQAVTFDVCNDCWGSGIKEKPWPSHRLLHAARRAEAEAEAEAEAKTKAEKVTDGDRPE